VINALTKKIRAFLQRRKNRLSPKEVDRLRAMVQATNLKHLAIMPDGNRRWARAQGLSPLEGHVYGFTQTAPLILEFLFTTGIHTVTLGCCSTENLLRDPKEVANGMNAFDVMLQKILPFAIKHKVRIIHLGRNDRLPSFLMRRLQAVETKTQLFEDHVLNIGIDYGGKDEIIRACKKVLALGSLTEELTEIVFEQFLDTYGQPYPYPDLVIRTSGERRSSGFMPWQSDYSELSFISTYFPDLSPEIISRVIRDFSKRNRRFGK
jgi:undecaprenyl diphosphate synthase